MKFLEEAIANNPMIDMFGLHGLVVLEDKKTGKILLNKHNMILKNAKHLLFSKLLVKSDGTTFINNLTDVSVLDITAVNKSLKDIIVTYSDNDVSYTDEAKNIFYANNATFKEALDSENTEILVSDAHPDYYVLKITMSIKYGDFDSLDGKNSILINTLGITYGNLAAAGNDELFSRISFDPIIISQDSDLNLTYYIYF